MARSSSKGILVTTKPLPDRSPHSMLRSKSVPWLAVLFAVYITYLLSHIFGTNVDRVDGGDRPVKERAKATYTPATKGSSAPVVYEGDKKQAEAATWNDPSANDEYSTCFEKDKYRELFSLTKSDRKFYPISMGRPSYNPNILPHPEKEGQYIVMAQWEQYVETEVQDCVELICVAEFTGDSLNCTTPAVNMPNEASTYGDCPDDLAWMNFRFGPRDGRLVYGPQTPYMIYGSQGRHTCLSLWVQDFRQMTYPLGVDWPQTDQKAWYRNITEMSRPPPYGGMEKNFFLFWDLDNKTYVHNDITPRVFATIDSIGRAGEDLAPKSTRDGECADKHLPRLNTEYGVEGLHQATNSLSITMCERSDPSCVPSADNTYIMHVFQHKTYYDDHAIYEAYVVLFRRTFPFAYHAFGQKPYWITGRDRFSEKTKSAAYLADPEKEYPRDHTELFYVTSISWREHGLRYHGHVDDVLLVNFGIEDSYAGTIDVLAGELLKDLAMCDE